MKICEYEKEKENAKKGKERRQEWKKKKKINTSEKREKIYVYRFGTIAFPEKNLSVLSWFFFSTSFLQFFFFFHHLFATLSVCVNENFTCSCNFVDRFMYVVNEKSWKKGAQTRSAYIVCWICTLLMKAGGLKKCPVSPFSSMS